MNDYIYSASLNMVRAAALRHDYEMAGTWPSDAVALSSEQAREFMGDAPEGKIMAASDDGLPVWKVLPPPSPSELSAQAEKYRNNLLVRAEETIRIWQTKLLLGRISDEEKVSLNVWLDFIDAVQAVDTSSVKGIYWPSFPS